MDVVLVYFKKDGERKDFPLEKDKTVVGRHEDCDYRIPVSQVSREHCEIEITEDEVILRDLKSSNGTYVNNKRVAEVELRSGDHIIVGPVVFTVQIDGEPEDIYPVKIRTESREAMPTEEDITRDLFGDEEDEDETRRTALFTEGEADEDDEEVELKELDDDLDDEDDEDDDSLSQALEALASGGDDDVDPFADDEDEKNEK
jgi:pSer/pThr/pTyr-binding forkhead associated (FHA) protein